MASFGSSLITGAVAVLTSNNANPPVVDSERQALSEKTSEGEWTAVPLNLAADNWGAFSLPSWYSEVKNKILITPRSKNVGTIFDTFVVDAVIWNRHETQSINLNSIAVTGDNEGISLSGIETGDQIEATNDRLFEYRITVDGPVEFNVLYNYAFDLGDVNQRILGSRGLVLVSPPMERGYREVRRFDTEIIRMLSGLERRVRRFQDTDIPQRAISMPLKTFVRREFTRLQNILDFGLENKLSIPLWSSLSVLKEDTDGSNTIKCDTRNREFELVKRAVIINRNYVGYTVRDISSISDSDIVFTEDLEGVSHSSGDWVVPIVEATPQRGSAMSFSTDRSGQGHIIFEEISSGEPAIAPVFTKGIFAQETYQGYPVFDPTLREAIQQAHDVEYHISGDIHGNRLKTVRQPSESQITAIVYALDEEEQNALRQFFDWCRGTVKPFWFRTHKADFIVEGNHFTGSTTFTVEGANHEAGLQGKNRHIYSRKNSKFYKIGSYSKNTESTTLNITSPLVGDELAGNQFERLFLCRFDSDELPVEYNGLGVDVRSVTLQLREVQKETP